MEELLGTSLDVRNGLITREEAFELISKHDKEVPEALNYFLEISGLDESQFYNNKKNESRRC